MNILMPLEKTNAEQLINNNMALTGGHYIFGANRHWHGGMHFTSTKKVQAIADGTLIAYRITEDYLTYNYDKNGTAISAPYSNNFALIKHQFKSPKGAELTYYSLYMHLLPAKYLEADKQKTIPTYLQVGSGSEVEAIVNSDEDPQSGLHLRSTKTGGIRAFASYNSTLEIIQPPLGYTTDDNYLSYCQNQEKNSNWKLVKNGSNEVFQAYLGTEQAQISGTIATVITHEDFSSEHYGLRIREGGPGGKILRVAKKGQKIRVLLNESQTWYKVTEVNGEPAPENSYICNTRERLIINPHEVDDNKSTGSVICPNIDIQAGACLGYPGHNLDQKNCLHFEIFTDESLITFMKNPYNEGEKSILKIPATTPIYRRKQIPVEPADKKIRELTQIEITETSTSGDFVKVKTIKQAGLLRHADLIWHSDSSSYTIKSNLEIYKKYWGNELTTETPLNFLAKCNESLDINATNPEWRLACVELTTQSHYWVKKTDLSLIEIPQKGSFLKSACECVYTKKPEQYFFEPTNDYTSDDVTINLTNCTIEPDNNSTTWVNARLPRVNKGAPAFFDFSQSKSWPKQNNGWVREKDCEKLSPYDWPGFKLLKETGLGGKDAYIDVNNLNKFFREIIDTIDINNDGMINYQEIRNAYKNPTINQRLAYTIAKHPTEWDVDESVTKWSHLETWFKSSESFEEAKKQIRNLTFWGEINTLNYTDVYHINPLSFIRSIKCMYSRLSDELKIMIATIYGEAANSSPTAWKAVAWVIMNRIGYREWAKYNNVKDIIINTGFDAYKHQTKEYKNAINYLNGKNTDARLDTINQIAKITYNIYNRLDTDITENSVLYYSPNAQAYLHKRNPSMYAKKPKWNFSLLTEVKISGLLETDDFKFYKY
jgi:hypothetical protein